jgi:hypothetical protein
MEFKYTAEVNNYSEMKDFKNNLKEAKDGKDIEGTSDIFFKNLKLEDISDSRILMRCLVDNNDTHVLYGEVTFKINSLFKTEKKSSAP